MLCSHMICSAACMSAAATIWLPFNEGSRMGGRQMCPVWPHMYLTRAIAHDRPHRWDSFSDRIACAWDATKCRVKESLGMSAVSLTVTVDSGCGCFQPPGMSAVSASHSRWHVSMQPSTAKWRVHPQDLLRVHPVM